MLRATRLSSFTLFLGASFGAIAASPQAEPHRPMLTFNVVALDAKGAPLRELPAADLRIYDDGKLMQAAFCHPLVTTEPQPARLGPGEYSNRSTGIKSQSVLVLLDLLNASLGDLRLGLNEIASTFQKLQSEDSLYLYLYFLTKEAALYPIHALPDVNYPISTGDSDWVAQVQSLLDQAMRKVDHLPAWELQVNADARVRKTLEAVSGLASDFAARPGRKSLVWISQGVPIGATGADGLWRDYTSPVMQMGTNVARSGIMIYTVRRVERTTVSFNSVDTMRLLAGLTAGQWLPSNATAKGIEQAVREGRATYEVGYIPSPDRWDNKFHKLRVSDENKGVRLRAIDGYYGDVRETDPRQRLARATIGPSDDSGIGIRATVTPSGKVKGWSHFQVRVDAADLQLTHGEAYTGDFSVTLAYYTDTTGWQPDNSEGIQTKLRLTPAELDTVMHDGVNLSFDRPVPASVHKTRIVVSDNQSGVVGSLTVAVAAP